jgi:hypothetical protein
VLIVFANWWSRQNSDANNENEKEIDKRPYWNKHEFFLNNLELSEGAYSRLIICHQRDRYIKNAKGSSSWIANGDWASWRTLLTFYSLLLWFIYWRHKDQYHNGVLLKWRLADVYKEVYLKSWPWKLHLESIHIDLLRSSLFTFIKHSA